MPAARPPCLRRGALRIAALALALLLGTPAWRGAAAQPAAPAAAASGLAAHALLVYRTTAEFHFGGLPLSMSARTTTSWRLDGRVYETHLHMDRVDFDQLSHGEVGADGAFAPTRYTEKRPFHDPESVAIDWVAGKIRYGAGPKSAAPPPGAQDRLSLQFELARRRLSHPEQFAPGSRHEVRLIGTHDVDPWMFEVGAEESVETGRGALHAVRCSARRTVGTAVETIDIWLGAELSWLPVRIRMVDRKGAVIDSVLQSAELP